MTGDTRTEWEIAADTHLVALREMLAYAERQELERGPLPRRTAQVAALKFVIADLEP